VNLSTPFFSPVPQPMNAASVLSQTKTGARGNDGGNGDAADSFGALVAQQGKAPQGQAAGGASPTPLDNNSAGANDGPPIPPGKSPEAAALGTPIGTSDPGINGPGALPPGFGLNETAAQLIAAAAAASSNAAQSVPGSAGQPNSQPATQTNSSANGETSSAPEARSSSDQGSLTGDNLPLEGGGGQPPLAAASEALPEATQGLVTSGRASSRGGDSETKQRRDEAASVPGAPDPSSNALITSQAAAQAQGAAMFVQPAFQANGDSGPATPDDNAPRPRAAPNSTASDQIGATAGTIAAGSHGLNTAATNVGGPVAAPSSAAASRPGDLTSSVAGRVVSDFLPVTRDSAGPIPPNSVATNDVAAPDTGSTPSTPLEGALASPVTTTPTADGQEQAFAALGVNPFSNAPAKQGASASRPSSAPSAAATPSSAVGPVSTSASSAAQASPGAGGATNSGTAASGPGAATGQAFSGALAGRDANSSLTSGGSGQRNAQHGTAQAAPVTVVAQETHAPPVPSLSPVQQIATSIIEAADAASSAEEAGPAPPAGAPASPQKGLQPLQVLDIKLEPADLGSVSVKLRLSGTKLELHIEVAQKDTLPLLHKEGDSLSSQLQSSGYSVDTLTIKAAENGGAAAQQQHGGHGAAQGQSQGQGQGQQQAQSQSASFADQSGAGQGGEARSNDRSPSGSAAGGTQSSSRSEFTQDGVPQARPRGDLYV
jgi:hypothetical protein